MTFKRGEFVGLMVESAVDNQQRLVKFESKESDRSSRGATTDKIDALAPGFFMIPGSALKRLSVKS